MFTSAYSSLSAEHESTNMPVINSTADDLLAGIDTADTAETLLLLPQSLILLLLYTQTRHLGDELVLDRL